jgi:Tfp pilus assembly protein PilF
LQITTKQYDIISSNAVNARLSGNLYTSQFYRLCKEKLTDSGIMCQWLSTNWILESEYKMLLKSFTEVFPHTSLWCIDAGHLLLIGTTHSLQIDYHKFSKSIKQDSIRIDLTDYGLADVNAMLALYICSTPEIIPYIGTSADNNDDLPLVEMSRVVSMARNPRIIESLFEQKKNLASIFIPSSLTREDSAALADYFLAEKLLLESTLKSRYQNKPLESLQLLIKATRLAPTNYTLYKNLAILYYAGANTHQAVKSLVRAINIHPKLSQDHEQLGIILFNSASYKDALHAFENALLLNPERPLSRYYRAAIFKMANNTLMAKSELKEIIRFFPEYIEAYHSLALIYEEQKDYDRALEYYRHCFRLDANYKNVSWKINQLVKQSVN